MKKVIILLATVFISLASFAQTNPAKADSTTKVVYSCPMHPEITGKATDKCSKCKMALKPTKQFVCPMHADVKSNKKAKCTKCGMDLVEVKKH